MKFIVDWERLAEMAQEESRPEIMMGRALGLALTRYGLDVVFTKGAEYTGKTDWIKVLDRLIGLKKGQDLTDDDVVELLKAASVVVTNQVVAKSMDIGTSITQLRKIEFLETGPIAYKLDEGDKEILAGFQIGVLEGFEKGLTSEMSKSLKAYEEQVLEQIIPDVYRIMENIPEEEVLDDLTTQEKVAIDRFLTEGKSFKDLSQEERETIIKGFIKAGEPSILSMYVRARAELSEKPPTTNYQIGYDDEEVKRRSGPSL